MVRRFPRPDPLISPLPVSPMISPLPSTPTTEFETATEDEFYTAPEAGTTTDEFVTADEEDDDEFDTPPHPPPLDLIPPSGIPRPRGQFFPNNMEEGPSRPRGTFYDPLWRPPRRLHHRRRGPAVLPTDDDRDSSPYISLESTTDTTFPSTDTDNECWARLVTTDDDTEDFTTAPEDDTDDNHGRPPDDIDQPATPDDDDDDDFHTPPESSPAQPRLISIFDFMRAWQAGVHFTDEERRRNRRMLETDDYAVTLVMAGGNCTIPLHGPNSQLDQFMRTVRDRFTNVSIDVLDVSDAICTVLPNEVT